MSDHEGTSQPAQKPVIFETTARVRFREVDPYGHMNMACYLAHYIDHRFDGMRDVIGLGLAEIAALKVAFHTRSITIEYLRPLLADQEFRIRSYVSELKRSQCLVDLAMIAQDGQTASTAQMRIGCIDKASGRPCGWPPGLMERFFL
jgi:acyl-CoA thioester hydrolase